VSISTPTPDALNAAAPGPSDAEVGQIEVLKALKERIAERRKLKYALPPESFQEKYRNQHKNAHAVDADDLWLTELAIGALCRLLAASKVRESRTGEAVAWKHTLHMEHDQTSVRLTHSPDHPFGEPGRTYSAEYTVTSTPLYASLRPSDPPAAQAGEGWREFDGVPAWAEGREWSSETPFHWPGGPAIAFDDETGEPLAQVWWAKSDDGFGLETTHHRPLPAPPCATSTPTGAP
jgi:hypothetical protein